MFGIYFRYLADRVIHLFVCESWIVNWCCAICCICKLLSTLWWFHIAFCLRLYCDMKRMEWKRSIDQVVVWYSWGLVCCCWLIQNLPCSTNTFLLPVWIRTEKKKIDKKSKCLCVSFFRLKFLFYFFLSISPVHVGFDNFHKILTIFSICIYLWNFIIWSWIDSSQWIEHWLS